MLSDAEYLRAIKAAKEATADGTIPFELALSAAIDSLERKKQEEMLNDVEVTGPTEEVAPLLQEYHDPLEMTVPREGDPFNLDNFIRTKYVYASELFSSAAAFCDLSSNPIGTRRYVEAASNGAYSSDYADTVIPTLQNEPQGSNGFGDCIKELNMVNREAYYAYYAMSSAEELEREREEAVKMYERLQQRGKEAHKWLDVDRSWNHEAATIVVANEISMRDKRAEMAGIHEVGIVSFEPGMDMRPGEVSYSPACYDNAYYVLSGRLTKEGDFHNKRMFEEAQVLCDQKLDQLRNMTAEEYRAYRIDQMKVVEQEKTRFDGDLGLATEKEVEAHHSK
jgi:hypothetical protein